jgi:hypothetical protein
MPASLCDTCSLCFFFFFLSSFKKKKKIHAQWRESGSKLERAPAFHGRWIGLDPPRLLCWLPRHNTFQVYTFDYSECRVRLCIPFSLLGWLADCVRVSNQKSSSHLYIRRCEFKK